MVKVWDTMVTLRKRSMPQPAVASFVEKVDFVHEGRASNVDAHRLARSFVSYVLGRHVWFLDLPHGVCIIL